jgi:hypothetical protein
MKPSAYAAMSSASSGIPLYDAVEVIIVSKFGNFSTFSIASLLFLPNARTNLMSQPPSPVVGFSV